MSLFSNNSSVGAVFLDQVTALPDSDEAGKPQAVCRHQLFT